MRLESDISSIKDNWILSTFNKENREKSMLTDATGEKTAPEPLCHPLLDPRQMLVYNAPVKIGPKTRGTS